MWWAYLVVFALGFIAQVTAQEISFEASVDRTRLGQSEPLQLTLSIVSDESLSHVPAPTIVLGDFHVQGPAISTRIEMVNFSTSFTRELTYTLYAKRTGKMRLGPASIEIGGKMDAAGDDESAATNDCELMTPEQLYHELKTYSEQESEFTADAFFTETAHVL